MAETGTVSVPELRSTEPVGAAPGPESTATSTAYAIIETGGKQYRVSVGDRLAIEKLPVEPGEDITFDRVLMIGGDGSARIGAPVVAGASVSARVEEQFRGDKIIVFKYKPKKRYRRRLGHRQSLTRIAITGINA
jgi:large subunit ribosomal protein L21